LPLLTAGVAQRGCRGSDRGPAARARRPLAGPRARRRAGSAAQAHVVAASDGGKRKQQTLERFQHATRLKG